MRAKKHVKEDACHISDEWLDLLAAAPWNPSKLQIIITSLIVILQFSGGKPTKAGNVFAMREAPKARTAAQ